MLAELAASEKFAGEKREGIRGPGGDENEQIAQRLRVAHEHERSEAEGHKQHSKRGLGKRGEIGFMIEQHRCKQQIQPVNEIQRIQRGRAGTRQQRRGGRQQRRWKKEKQACPHADAAEHLVNSDNAQQRDGSRIDPCA